MRKRIVSAILAAALVAGVAVTAQAALFDVSPTLTDGTAAGVPAGFPLWYQDYSDFSANPSANINYGIGPTAGGLAFELCPDLTVDPFCISDATADEFFYWDATTSIPIPAGGALTVAGSADIILATEGVTAANPSVFNRVRIRIDTPVAGTYTVTHPFGVNVYNAPAGVRGINDSLDQGCPLGTIGCDFRLALNTAIGSYLFWDSGLPLAGAVPGNFYVGDAATPHKVLGSPKGTNYFRVDGPPGSNLGGPGVDFIQSDLFVVSGKVFTAGGTANTAPVAVADAATTLAGTPVAIDVLANDTFTDVPILPTSLAFSSPVGGTVAMTIVDGQVKASFTPAAGFTGAGGFNYTVTGFAGMVSAPATAVTVVVEDLKVTKAEFRPKFLKWRISGTSSDTAANAIAIQSGPPTVSASLSGAKEVPTPNNSPGSGTVTVTVGETSLGFTLSLSGLLNITSTHLHLGASGANGPILFTLAGPNTTIANGTLTAADLDPAAGITYADAVNAVLGGNAYVQVHTAAIPAGELRGQLGPNRLVGTVPVLANGTWALEGKSKAFPDGSGTISVRSSNGVQLEVPLQLR